ncbi:sh3 domain-containing protein [Striga asiatica]|uniref:Sh3 domain-containing protein n=1 Tax=Striga asiatica TaxID=4170 RepID=A0A5A7PLN8_STRAF|nr:sh3 domain-containing protein [Striga asiatica]
MQPFTDGSQTPQIQAEPSIGEEHSPPEAGIFLTFPAIFLSCTSSDSSSSCSGHDHRSSGRRREPHVSHRATPSPPTAGRREEQRVPAVRSIPRQSSLANLRVDARSPHSKLHRFFSLSDFVQRAAKRSVSFQPGSSSGLLVLKQQPQFIKLSFIELCRDSSMFASDSRVPNPSCK